MIRKLTRITSVAAVLPATDIDTDAILPARFLLLLDRRGLGTHLFHDLRHGVVDSAKFILDTPPFDAAEILIAGQGFGTGSSREHAVWALADFGIRCIVTPGFGEIFHANCIKNGILPITLDPSDHARVMAAAQGGDRIAVDLQMETIQLPHGRAIAFKIDTQHRHALLNGIDEIGEILANDVGAVAAFEARQRQDSPWLHLSEDQFASFRISTRANAVNSGA